MTGEELVNSEEYQVGMIEYAVFDLVCKYVDVEVEYFDDTKVEGVIPSSRVNVSKVKTLLSEAGVDPRKARRLLRGEWNPTITEVFRIAKGCGKKLKITFEE